MNRRHFLKKAALTTTAFAVPGTIDSLFSYGLSSPPIDLAVAHGKSPGAITKAAIDGLGGIHKFISKGDIVVIKPNMAWDRIPEQAGNTNPEVVSTVVKLCFEAGAKKVKVFDRPVNDPRRCYIQSGIADAAGRLGADVLYVDERKFKDMQIKGQYLKNWPLYSEVFEADKVINMPIAKHHSLAKLTLSMKNWMGIMGGRRSKIHQRLDESLVDLSMHIKPTLTILDAVRILTANGPQGGSFTDVKKMDTIIAGVDPVAIDAYGATLFGMKGDDLGYVRIGHEIGYGNKDLNKLNIKKINA